jgi:hypothetical protein
MDMEKEANYVLRYFIQAMFRNLNPAGIWFRVSVASNGIREWAAAGCKPGEAPMNVLERTGWWIEMRDDSTGTTVRAFLSRDEWEGGHDIAFDPFLDQMYFALCDGANDGKEVTVVEQPVAA